jgi:DMSO reductase family type II enzyme heme b subunit
MGEFISLATVDLSQERSLGPWTAGWGSGSRIALHPTPLESQPSAYVQEAWRDRLWGRTPEVLVHFVQTTRLVLVRMEWACQSPRFRAADNDVFADACALLFPANGQTAPLATMGSEAEPVVAWQWRAGAETAYVADATGLGTLSRRQSHDLTVTAEWRQERWAVVFAHPLAENNGRAGSPGASDLVAFAVWEGANQERAGLASYSPVWSRLRKAVPAGGAR